MRSFAYSRSNGGQKGHEIGIAVARRARSYQKLRQSDQRDQCTRAAAGSPQEPRGGQGIRCLGRARRSISIWLIAGSVALGSTPSPNIWRFHGPSATAQECPAPREGLAPQSFNRSKFIGDRHRIRMFHRMKQFSVAGSQAPAQDPTLGGWSFWRVSCNAWYATRK